MSKKTICIILVLVYTVLITTICSYAQEPLEGEFEYVLSDDWNYYIVKGIGTFVGENAVIPETHNGLPVAEIAEGAFSSCLTLESLYVPATVERIGKYAFSDCKNLKSVTILCRDMGYNWNWSSANAKKCYGYSILNGCQSLEYLYIRDVEFEAYLSSVYNYINYYPIGYIFGTSYYSGSTSCYQPYYIGDKAAFGYTYFYFPKSLKSITLGGYGLESYTGGGYTNPFQGCYSVDEIIIDDGVSWVAHSLFKGLRGIETLVLPESITIIDEQAFYNSNISNINYYGTPSQWAQVAIGSYNDELIDKIKFVKFTTTSISEDGKIFTVTPKNIENEKTVVLALYNDGIFVEMQHAIYEGDEISFVTTKEYANAKVMVWDDLTNLKPACNVEIVK